MRAVILLGLLLLLPACADPETASDAKPPAAQPDDAEFARRLRLGVEQLRKYLPDSARAEFERCAEIRPDDPELLFHRARLELMQGGAGQAVAIPLLERVVEINPDSVKALRLLYEFDLYGGEPTADVRRAEIERIYGQMGRLEMASHTAYFAQERAPHLRWVDEPPGIPFLDTYRDMKAGLMRLNKEGNYSPSEGVPVVERTLKQFPDLAVVRLDFAKMLIFGEIRVNYSDRPDLPLNSSTLILDLSQAHYEQVFDMLNPGSRMALDTLMQLSHAALLMGDYDEMLAYLEILGGMPKVEQEYRQFLLQRRGLARYKQGRFDEAADLLNRSLEASDRRMDTALKLRWVLHLAYEAAGTPPEQRRNDFAFRADLPRRRGSTRWDFEDIAPRLRIDKEDGAGPSAWGDYDGDGDFDLFATGADSYGVLFRNDGEVFTDVSREAGLFRSQSGFGATFADYDADGWMDLHIGRDGWNGLGVNALFHNNGDGTFTEVTERAGLGDPGSSFVCAWSDVDRDGDIDLMVANGVTLGGDTNALYRNNGDGTFTDVTREAGLLEASGTRTIALAFGDYDLDGWPDLFVSGFATRNRLYRNKGDGTFVEVAREVGVAREQGVTAGYVAFFVDFDNDLDLDILRTTLSRWPEVLVGMSEYWDSLPAEQRQRLAGGATQLYRNEGDGTFTDISAQAGFVHPIGTMGAGMADLDNDGYLDLYLATGDPSIERMEPDRFYHNNGDGTFTDVTFAAGLGNVGKGHGVTFTDIDGDGDLEIYAPEGGFVHGDAWPNAFYLNRQETGNHWLHIDLEGSKSNRDALDTKLYVRAGQLNYLREVHNGEGFGSSNSPTVELGLGRAQKVDRLEIHWPSGEVQIFEDLPVDRRIFLREGEDWRPVDRRDSR